MKNKKLNIFLCIMLIGGGILTIITEQSSTGFGNQRETIVGLQAQLVGGMALIMGLYMAYLVIKSCRNKK
jgi:hypothetical protein